ncbi:MAG: PIG-L family deacetylase [Nitrospirae bacterium]|nr:PIG-L family deacetylase [Nitrospirota bacterium]
MKKNDKTILVIAPHLDDEVLGCGGVIARHVSQGDKVYVCFVAHRVYDHVYDAAKMEVEKEQAMEAKKALGYHEASFLNLQDERLDNCIQDIIIPLEKYVMKVRPQVIYSPFCNDNNQDHQAVAKAVQVVLRPVAAPFVQRWLMFETPSSTEQAPAVGVLGFHGNVYYDISDYLDIKLKALTSYETEFRRFPHPRSPEGIRTLAMKRGMEAGLHYAESFMMVREKQ